MVWVEPSQLELGVHTAGVIAGPSGCPGGDPSLFGDDCHDSHERSSRSFSLPQTTHFAVVIGNAMYTCGTLGCLSSSTNDAMDMAALLQGKGYAVSLALDCTKAELEATLAGFVGTLPKDCTVVVYYSGHGMSGTARDGAMGDVNYMIPVDGKAGMDTE